MTGRRCVVSMDVVSANVPDAAAWLAEFARREAVYRFERTMFGASVAAKIAAERAPAVKPEIVPIVLDEAHEVDVDDPGVPDSARRLERAARAAGWFPLDLVAAMAADPGRGVVRTLSVRARRRDERTWAIWLNGSFDQAWYSGPTGLERLGWARMKAGPARTAMSVDSMSLSQIKALAAGRGIKIPSKFKKSEVVEFVKAAGLTAGEPAPPLRGVLDAIEGVRGPRQWLAHFEAIERERVAAAVAVISQTFPGLQLIHH